MFEYRKGTSPGEVAALFGDGITPIYTQYVEDSDTGTLLAHVGGLGRDQEGRVYLLRWGGRSLGLHATVTYQQAGPGTYPVFTLRDLGTSVFARNLTRVTPIELAPGDAAAAYRVAAEACVAFETYRGDFGPGARVIDPHDTRRELSPAHFGYPGITRLPLGLR